MTMESYLQIRYLVASVVYSGIGLVVFFLGFWLFDKFTPGDFWKELMGEKNTALAIVVAAFMIGISIIISSAIHG
jgi:putative membrane protein